MSINNQVNTAEVWSAFWDGSTPESEIRMWDFYGGRPWILKHVPRHGKVLEAGCGLGRYVFLLSRLGIDVDGLDFHEPTVVSLSRWAKAHGFDCRFICEDVSELPYDSGSVSGYLSFGVIEHFEEGPAQALMEAYRVLRPGGIAIISTPSLSFTQRYFRLRKSVRQYARRLLGRPQRSPDRFFQYWYKPRELAAFVQGAGLRVVLAGACDLRYAAWELYEHLKLSSNGNSLGFRIADRLERTFFAQWGAQAITVSVKVAPKMYCFVCGEQHAEPGDLHAHYLPICQSCVKLPQARYYRHRIHAPRFHEPCRYNPVWPDVSGEEVQLCHFCGNKFMLDLLFDGDHGFSVPICPGCLSTSAINIIAANEFLKPRWRPRKQRI